MLPTSLLKKFAKKGHLSHPRPFKSVQFSNLYGYNQDVHILYLYYTRSFIPDEHMVWCPEQLLQCMLAHIHYMPDHWRGSANKSETRDEVAQLFQYKAVRDGETVTIGTHLSQSNYLLIYFND